MSVIAAGLTSGSADDVAKFHSHLGKTLYGFAGAACQQQSDCTSTADETVNDAESQGLTCHLELALRSVRSWATSCRSCCHSGGLAPGRCFTCEVWDVPGFRSLLLSVILIASTSATIFFLNGRSPEVVKRMKRQSGGSFCDETGPAHSVESGSTTDPTSRRFPGSQLGRR